MEDPFTDLDRLLPPAEGGAEGGQEPASPPFETTAPTEEPLAASPRGPVRLPVPPGQAPSPPRQPAIGQNPTTSSRAGLGLLAVAAGAAIGASYGKAYGGLAGALFAGAALNAGRAIVLARKGTEDREAVISGTYAVASIVLGAVVWTKLVDKRPQTATANPEKEEEPKKTKPADEQTLCGIRPVGP